MKKQEKNKFNNEIKSIGERLKKLRMSKQWSQL